MKIITSVFLISTATAFHTSSLPTQRVSKVSVFGYVPDGFTKESYAKFKAEEAKKKAAKNLGRVGPKGFQSRSFQSFQEALERGETTHLLPVLNAKERYDLFSVVAIKSNIVWLDASLTYFPFKKHRLKKGEIKMEDIPYMQRGGNWDNSDVKGAKRVQWLKSDKEYASGGFKKEQSVSIFGKGEGLDWTGNRSRSGPVASSNPKPGTFGKNYKAPNVNDLKKGQQEDAPKKKGLFGLW